MCIVCGNFHIEMVTIILIIFYIDWSNIKESSDLLQIPLWTFPGKEHFRNRSFAADKNSEVLITDKVFTERRQDREIV